ncbi:MAG TPA: DUF6443 domain-containing protein [Puia sp.]|nr:DUF6443 domain-containing protein [Puia sp.]
MRKFRSSAVRKRMLLIGAALVMGISHGLGQASVSGPTCVMGGSTQSYTLFSASASGFTYSISNGTLAGGGANGSGSGNTNINVTWTAGTGSGSILLNSSDGNASITVAITTALQSGIILTADLEQSINYNAIPQTISCSPATGEACPANYVYQWQQSTSYTSGYTNVSGATGQNMTFTSPLTSTLYYRRMVTETNSGTTAYTDPAEVNVYPQLVSGSIQPSTQTINYNITPGGLNDNGTTGGAADREYQWQSSSSIDGPYTNINNAVSSSYNPPALATTTYYQVVTGSNGVYVTSAPATVIVQLAAGNISSASSTDNYGVTPASLSVSPVGGDGSYIYQWYSDATGSYQPITGAIGASYSPGTLYASTSYYVVVTDADMTSQTPSFAVTVYPQLFTGTINPASQLIGYNTSPSLSETGMRGGTGTYSYQWYYSATSSGPWRQISSILTTNSFSPGALTTTTYFEVVTSSNGVSVTSEPVVVNVAPQLLAGTLSPAAITISSGTSPGMLTCNEATGGNCGRNYAYTWQSSPDGNTWTAITGVTGLTYNPGNLSITTYYQVVVSCGGQTATSNTALIQVGTVGNDWSFVRTRDIIKSGVTDTTSATALNDPTDVKQVTRYVDGLGRPLQEVAMKASPLGNDMVAIHAYDAVGREAVKYMPYTSASNDGNFKTDPFAEQSTFNTAEFPGDQFFYGQINYEPSPLNRISTAYAPGISWVGSDRGDGIQYMVNTNNDSVVLWTIASAPGSVPVAQGSYAAGTLLVIPTTDENGHQVVEYTDLQGRTLLTKAQLWDSPAAGPSGWLNTYYVYDTLNNLRFVMPPKAVDWLKVNSWNFAASGGQAVDSELCYRYEYDYRQRMIVKKVPGAGETWAIYDIRDRPVMTEDANLRRSGQWLVSQYDALNRLVEVGLIGYTSTLTAMQQLVTTQTTNGGASGGEPVDTTISSTNTTGDVRASHSITAENGFSSADGGTFIGEIVNGNWGSGGSSSNSNSIALSPVPNGVTLQPLIITYYDDYNWVSGSGTGLPSTFASSVAGNGTYFITSYNMAPTYAVSVTPLLVTRGQVTGTQTLVLGSNGQYLSAINFYDDRHRLIQTQSINYTGGLDTVTTQYDFRGKPLRSLLGHAKPTNTVQCHQILTKANYDPNFRLTSIYKSIDGAPTDQLIDTMQYDELGQLRAKYLGKDPASGQALDSIVYDYNILGWLTGINKNYVAGTAQHYFGMELGYDNPTSVSGTSYSAPTYNGNIAGTIWKSAGDGVNRKYDFFYDNVNRLTGAAYLDNHSGAGWDAAAMDYSVSGLTYDANGNILSMIQKGFKVGNPTGIIDSLTYTYTANSNKLFQVHDGANDTASVLGDFHYKGLKADSDYRYDDNGSLNMDNNKGIDTIVYNYLNLPQRVHMKGKGNILYTYDATGEKLVKQTIDSMAAIATTTLYLDGFQYQRRTPLTNTTGGIDTLQFVGHEEGRARWAFQKYLNGDSAYNWQYDFCEVDQLGNTRVLLSQEKDTAQYVATMEAANRPTENALFYNIDSTSYARSDVAGYPDDLSVTSPNDSVARVNGNGPKAGPAIILKVMSGDKVDIGVQYYYNPNNATTASPLSPQNLLNSLASGLAAVSGPAEASIATLNNSGSSPLLAALSSSIDSQNSTQPNKPQAYLNWVLLDNQFNYVGGNSQSGALQVGAAGTQANGSLQTPLAYNALPITKSGYLYIYLSNATQGWDVFFDNLSVKHYSGPMVEENHYYPFGLTMAGLSDKAIKSTYAVNKYRFNDASELANNEFSNGTGLEEYETDFRGYDPQLGRFCQIDPIGELFQDVTPYSFAFNNPVLYNDPLGLDPEATNNDAGSGKPKPRPKPKPKPKVDVLPSVVVVGYKPKGKCHTCDVPDITAKKPDKPTPLKFMYWPDYTQKDVERWEEDHYLYLDRLQLNQPFIQGGESDHYLQMLSTYERWTRADNDGRTMQVGAVVIILGPALGVELGMGVDMAAMSESINDAYEFVYYFMDRGYNEATRDLFYAIRYGLRNKLTMDQIIRLERLAEKYRPLNKILNEKTVKQVLKQIDKILKSRH